MKIKILFLTLTVALFASDIDFVKLNKDNYLGHNSGTNFLNISTHEINYFLPLSYTFKGKYPSDKRAEAKFQISVKKPLFEDIFNLNEQYYFAYTQRAWWQIYKYSAPFRELNYQPEFFISFPTKFENFKSLQNIRVGFLHESNGRDDTNLLSRSWNKLYASFAFFQGPFMIVPRFWYIIPEASLKDNKDIRHYAGNFDLSLKYLGKNYFGEVLIKNNLNFTDNKASFELNLGFEPFGNGVFLYTQYYYGYVENLLTYKKLTNKLSIGFLIAY